MVTQRDILTYLADRTRRERPVTVRDLVDEFLLSSAAAHGHLARLWRERLVEVVTPRPPRFGFRLLPGEQLDALRFHLARRGRARLRWYEAQDAEDSLFE